MSQAENTKLPIPFWQVLKEEREQLKSSNSVTCDYQVTSAPPDLGEDPVHDAWQGVQRLDTTNRPHYYTTLNQWINYQSCLLTLERFPKERLSRATLKIAKEWYIVTVTSAQSAANGLMAEGKFLGLRLLILVGLFPFWSAKTLARKLSSTYSSTTASPRLNRLLLEEAFPALFPKRVDAQEPQSQHEHTGELQPPLQPTALCFSGGGIRSASFCLVCCP